MLTDRVCEDLPGQLGQQPIANRRHPIRRGTADPPRDLRPQLVGGFLHERVHPDVLEELVQPLGDPLLPLHRQMPRQPRDRIHRDRHLRRRGVRRNRMQEMHRPIPHPRIQRPISRHDQLLAGVGLHQQIPPIRGEPQRHHPRLPIRPHVNVGEDPRRRRRQRPPRPQRHITRIRHLDLADEASALEHPFIMRHRRGGPVRHRGNHRQLVRRGRQRLGVDVSPVCRTLLHENPQATLTPLFSAVDERRLLPLLRGHVPQEVGHGRVEVIAPCVDLQGESHRQVTGPHEKSAADSGALLVGRGLRGAVKLPEGPLHQPEVGVSPRAMDDPPPAGVHLDDDLRCGVSHVRLPFRPAARIRVGGTSTTPSPRRSR